MGNTKTYVKDYISGNDVEMTPEEESVQEMARILVEDYEYPKDNIRTRPQYRVRARPSGRQEYPVDIAIFNKPEHDEDNILIIVECKRREREDGIEQLQDYLRFSNAQFGVWYNQGHKAYLKKHEQDGKMHFHEVPNIPKYGQRYEDIGLFTRKDLRSTHNLKNIFKSIRNYLYGNAVGTTRDEEFAKQIINIIFCKLYDEKNTKPDDIIKFRAGIDEQPETVAKRIKERFDDAKETYRDVLRLDDRIELDDRSLTFVAGELQNYSLMNTERDVVADAFEVFIGKALKGPQGQFFTPRNVVKTAIEILDPSPEDTIIDPACGSGGFLVEALKYISDKIDHKAREYNWSQNVVDTEKVTIFSNNLKGIEKDSFLSKVAKAYMVILGDGRRGIFCEDSLNIPENDWSDFTTANIQLNSFTMCITNPPFGANILVKGRDKLSQYELGHKWEKSKRDGTWHKDRVKESETALILFIDRCLDFLVDGGKLAIVLPDGILSNPTHEYIRHSILQRAEIIGLIDLPMSTFLPNTPTKTHLVFLKKKSAPRSNYQFFMGYAKTCGHDKRGKDTGIADEIRLIPKHIKQLKEDPIEQEHSRLGWLMDWNAIRNNILMPKYYNPEIEDEIKDYESSGKFTIKTMQELLDAKIIQIKRGHEVGSINYGTGDVPFIRTSEIANWEIIADPTHTIAEDVYEQYKDSQNLQAEDLLVVNDGTYLMGRTAMLTDLDLKIVVQSHVRIVRVLDKEQLSPYLLLSLLGLKIVQKQIEAKSFRQSTITTLGNRLSEIKIPMPTDEDIRRDLTTTVNNIIMAKRNAKYHSKYTLLNKEENLMGIGNKAKLGNL